MHGLYTSIVHVQLIGPHAVFTLPLVLLIVSNLLPIAGAIQFGWNLYTLLLLYWIENAIVGILTIAKMTNASKKGELGKSRSYQAIFFVAHYSTFWVLHGVVLVTVFQIAGARTHGMWQLFLVTLLLYAVHHGVSHRKNWLGLGEYERMSSTDVMALPYVRVGGVLLLTLVGGVVVWQLGEPPMALAALAALKLIVDAASYVFVHRTIAARASSAAE